MVRLKMNLRSCRLRLIFGVMLWGMSLLALISAKAEKGPERTGSHITIQVPAAATVLLAGPDGFASSADAATVTRPNRLRPMGVEIAALQTSASAGAPAVWGDVSSVTVAATGLSAHQAIPAVSLTPAGATATRDLSSYFSFPTVTGAVVEFDTVVGTFAVELYGDDAPLNVANFLQHVNAGSYTNTFIHRSVPNFVIQGGGYYAASNLPDVIRLGTAALEYKIPNYRGTLAMARGSDPNSAGSQWFINTVDNADSLKPLGAGYDGYTVIGRVLGGGLTVVDALAALPVYYLSDLFNEVPLYNYVLGNSLTLANLVAIHGIAEVPVYPTSAQPDALITFTASSSNEGVVRVTLSGAILTLTSVGEGSATVTVRATESAGEWVEQQFLVTVATPLLIGRHPASRVYVTGTNASFDVQVSGTAPLTYQWMKDGEPISAVEDVAGVRTDSLTVFGVSDASVGSYSVAVTNSAGTVVSDAAELTIVDQHVTHNSRGNGYLPGGVVRIDGNVIHSGAPTRVTWSVLLPDGWTYDGGGGLEFGGNPTAGDSGLIEFSWTAFPTPEFGFWYYLNVPTEATGDASFVGMVTITRAEDTQVLADPDPLVIQRAIHHTADTNDDFKLSLSELLRVIELYNTRAGTTRTGAYTNLGGTVDDFGSDTRAASTEVTLYRYHSADIDRDAKLNLSELLRVIELYNTRSGSVRTGQYRQDESTTDGFTADP